MNGLLSLKHQLQSEDNASEIWYHRHKVEQFERCLQGVETHYAQAWERLALLEMHLLSHSNPT